MKRGQEFSDKLLAKWIEYARTASKFHHRVAREMENLEPGFTVHRQQVARWLHPDDDVRVEPGLGVGMMLIKACERVAHQDRQRKARVAREFALAT